MIAALLDHLWQSTLFAAGAGLLTLALRSNRASLRYWIWFCASMKFLLPFSLLTTLGGHLLVHPLPPAIEAAPALFAIEQTALPFTLATQAPVATATPPDFAATLLAAILLGLWAVGFVAVLAIWAVRWRRIARVLREAKPSPLSAPIPVRTSPSTLEPGVVGIWRPVLLLPEGLADHLSPVEMDAVLAHELRHLRRHDNLTAGMHMLVEAVFWFHPLVWWLGARLIEARERACDEAVVEAGNDPKVYAGAILKVCKLYVQSPLACAAGISGADLKQRVETIMTTPIASRLNAAKALMLAGCAAAAFAAPLGIGMLGSAPAVAQAQDSAAQAPTAAQIARMTAEQQAPRKVVPLDPKQFAKYVGFYALEPNLITITTHDGRFFAKLTGQDAYEVYPESPTKFFFTVVAAQISFVTDARGKVAGLVLHQSGVERPAKKIDEATAKSIEMNRERRIKNNIPSPGTEAAARRDIAALESGKIDYNDMTKIAAYFRHQQEAKSQQDVKRWGPFKSINFKKVNPQGNDVYHLVFQNAQVDLIIAPLTADGKIAGLYYNEL